VRERTELAYDARISDGGMVSGGTYGMSARPMANHAGPRSASVQRLVLFDLDNTPVDRQSAFAAWGTEFAEERGLGHEAVC